MVPQITQTFETFENIGGVSATTQKQDILASGANSVTKTLLKCAYDPFLQYNIKKIPVDITSCTGTEITEACYGEFLELLVKLNSRDITGNAAIDALSDFLTRCSEVEYTWYTRVLQKDLKIGMAEKGINKVFKGLVPTYEVLLADKIPADSLNLDTPKALKLLPDRIVCQYKIDGYRLNIHVNQAGEVDIRTRNGKIVEGYNDLEAEAATKLPRGYVYDGEIVAPELFEWITKNAESATGDVIANRELFSEVMSHAFSKEDNKQGIFNLFDMIPEDEWKSQNTTETYETRLDRIAQQVKPLSLENIVIVPNSRVYLKTEPADLEEIVELFHQFLSVGWEGLMIKDLDAVYEFKRSKCLLKMKLMDSIDLTVTDVYEGEGKYQGMLGGVYVDYKGYQVGVGSGWSDDQRRFYWDNKNQIIGKTIEIAYQSESTNKNGGLSLSFPVVKKVRDDK